MSEKVWLDSYPANIPAEIDSSPFSSLPELIDNTVRKFADKPAFSNLGQTLSFGEVDRLSRDFAAFLQGLPGASQGDRVAIMLPNLLQYPVALFGILRAGMTVVNVNPLYTARELQVQLKDSGAKTIVVVENFARTLQEALPGLAIEHVITTQIGDLLPAPKRWVVNFVIKYVKKMVPNWQIGKAWSFKKALADGATSEFVPVKIGPEDLAFLQYTGGTTGIAKGAMLTHGNLLANLEQVSLWISASFKEGREIAIAPLPMYHIFCLTSTLGFMKWGSLTVLIANPRDLPGLVKELGRWRFSVLTGVNTLFNALLNTPGFAKLDFSALKVVVGGGAAVQESVAKRWQEVTGTHLTEAYGLTETSPGVCCTPLGDPWNGSIGLPVTSTEVSIRDEDFKKLPLWNGEGDIAQHTGEICVRGPQVMRGYWNKLEETAKVIQDGWLKTGDVGHMNARGYITLTDRKKDMILVSGFNVYPNEIENIVAMHPGVEECAVVGVPDEKSGEAVKLVIVRKDRKLSKEDVAKYCHTQLTGYKRPRHIEFRDSLPKTPIGKILRRELRDAPAG
ncbi:long-chain-fatty-acid--CoA ligase [Candidatus Accumulibacter phosphatis]|uniref:Long-chain-fatty-acid--CoA ligase n=1 Tax=Candidatus Accumulibacter phosphatis TaxID=327160 RepID=A0ABX1U523_9PROT|nr:AMP-binding protein [Candidatus Accumulibacter phosphatis]NMQ29943.1 long-chain-fatty-acid--CoA ligase [Candidatus Accumulibacter phosphatis]